MARRDGFLHGTRDVFLVIAGAAMTVGLTAVGSALTFPDGAEKPVETGPSRSVASEQPADDPALAQPACPCDGVSDPDRGSATPGVSAGRMHPGAPAADDRDRFPIARERAERRTFLYGNATLARRRLWVRPSQAAPPGQELQMVASSSIPSATPGTDLDR